MRPPKYPSRSPRMELVVLPDDAEAEVSTRTIKDDDDSIGTFDSGVSSIFGGFGSKTDRKKRNGKETRADSLRVDYDDEPGNFHLGHYHFSQNGVRYLSSNCKQCHEYVAAVHIAKSKDGALLTSKSKSLIRANSKNLAAKHSTLDVQNCSSTTCACCCSCLTDGGRGKCKVHSKASVAFIKAGDSTFFCHESKVGTYNNPAEQAAGKDYAKNINGRNKQSRRTSKLAFWSK